MLNALTGLSKKLQFPTFEANSSGNASGNSVSKEKDDPWSLAQRIFTGSKQDQQSTNKSPLSLPPDCLKQILDLSKDEKNLVLPPPKETDYVHVLDVEFVTKMLELDEKLRSERLKDDEFWRNYMYRVERITAQYTLDEKMAAENAVVNEKEMQEKPTENESAAEDGPGEGQDGNGNLRGDILFERDEQSELDEPEITSDWEDQLAEELKDL